LPQPIIVAINQEIAQSEQLVSTGDEVAFFPPVTGG
jgi:molybdopterin converting factor small subunit